MRQEQVPCPGSRQVVTLPARSAACPVCGRLITVNQTNGTLYRHVKVLGRSTRIWRHRRRLEYVRATNPPRGAQRIALKWWFEHFGGAEAFDDFKRGVDAA